MLSKKEDENFCFICYELKVKREKTPKKLKNQKFYITPFYISNADFYIVLNHIKIIYNSSLFFLFYFFEIYFSGLS
jgi:hypothetical protein